MSPVESEYSPRTKRNQLLLAISGSSITALTPAFPPNAISAVSSPADALTQPPSGRFWNAGGHERNTACDTGPNGWICPFEFHIVRQPLGLSPQGLPENSDSKSGPVKSPPGSAKNASVPRLRVLTNSPF